MQLFITIGITIAPHIVGRRINTGEYLRRIHGCPAAQESELLTEADL
jgi:hypothetical protein